MDRLLQNLFLSILWGFAIFFAALKDQNTETSILAAIVAFISTLAILDLLVDKEFSEDNAILIKTVLWTIGTFLAAVVLCQMVLVGAF